MEAKDFMSFEEGLAEIMRVSGLDRAGAADVLTDMIRKGELDGFCRTANGEIEEIPPSQFRMKYRPR